MSKKVKKRAGHQEDFIREKVVVSAVKAGAPVDVSRDIASKVEAEMYDGMATSEIRKTILEELHSKNPEWKQNALTYDRVIKKRTT